MYFISNKQKGPTVLRVAAGFRVSFGWMCHQTGLMEDKKKPLYY